MKAKHNLSLFFYLVFFFIFYTNTPFIQWLLPGVVTVILITMTFIIALLSIKNTRHVIFLLVMLIVFLLYYTLNALFKEQSLLMAVYNMIYSITPLLIGVVIVEMYGRNNNEAIKYFKPIIFTLLLTHVTTIIGLLSNQMISRDLASALESSSTLVQESAKMNIGGYGFIYMQVVAFPLVIWCVRTLKSRYKVSLEIIICVLYGFLLYLASYSIALIVFICEVVYLILLVNKKWTIALTITLICLTFIIFRVQIADLLIKISTSQSALFQQRMLYIANALNGDFFNGYEGTTRMNQYLRAIKAFISSPIFGSAIYGKWVIMESFMLSVIASFGITGGIVLFSIYRFLYKTFILPCKGTKYYGYSVCSFTAAIIISLVNTGMNLYVICVMSPIFFYATEMYTDRQKQKQL